MRKIGFWLILLLFISALLTAFLTSTYWIDYKKFEIVTKSDVAIEKPIELKAGGEGSKKYPSLFNGLKQFPLGYQPDGDEIVAMVIGCSYDDQERLRLELVTIEGNFRTITINRYSEVWLHEISPSIGKYTQWIPIITYFKKESQVYNSYNSFEIELEGRFVPVWGDKKDGEENIVIKYINEKYPF